LILQGVEFWHSPLTKAAAVNTVLRYSTPVILRSATDTQQQMPIYKSTLWSHSQHSNLKSYILGHSSLGTFWQFFLSHVYHVKFNTLHRQQVIGVTQLLNDDRSDPTSPSKC